MSDTQRTSAMSAQQTLSVAFSWASVSEDDDVCQYLGCQGFVWRIMQLLSLAMLRRIKEYTKRDFRVLFNFSDCNQYLRLCPAVDQGQRSQSCFQHFEKNSLRTFTFTGLKRLTAYAHTHKPNKNFKLYLAILGRPKCTICEFDHLLLQ